jgi:hypothetical protein
LKANIHFGNILPNLGNLIAVNLVASANCFAIDPEIKIPSGRFYAFSLLFIGCFQSQDGKQFESLSFSFLGVILMDQRELRRAAAQAFSESLEVLQKGLQPVENPPTTSTVAGSENKVSPVASAPSTPTSSPALAAWEEAAADIEEFIKSQQGS